MRDTSSLRLILKGREYESFYSANRPEETNRREAWPKKRKPEMLVSIKILRVMSKLINPIIYLLFSLVYIFVYFT